MAGICPRFIGAFMQNVLSTLAAATTVCLGLVAPSQAATVTYSNTDTTPKAQLVINDAAVPGALRFSLTTMVGTADYLGLGFNFDGPLTQANLSLVSATRLDGNAIAPTLQLFGNGGAQVSSCGSGCNFNGAGSASLFDYIIRIGSNGGGGNNYVASVVFDVTTSATLGDFSQLAFRAQSTSNPGGSIKADLVQLPPGEEPPAPVPLPASVVLLLAGMGGLASLRARKKAN